MKATSRVINAKFVEMDWKSMEPYNTENDTYRCRVIFSECSDTSDGSDNKALAFLQKVVSGNLYSVVINMDAKEFGENEDEKTKTFTDAMKDESGNIIPIPLTVVSVALDKTYYTEAGLPVDVRKIVYIGTDNHEEQAIASVTRRITKQIEDGELFAENPTKKQGGLEIERKFLIRKGSDYKSAAFSHSHIKQGYMPCQTATVRVRTRDDRSWLTIKSHSDRAGLSRYEFEKDITNDEAEHLFELCRGGVIDKCRWLVKSPDARHTFEVDEFFGDNAGLVVAEVELASEDEPFTKPCFIGEEVTGDRRYYNSQLLVHPYKEW